MARSVGIGNAGLENNRVALMVKQNEQTSLLRSTQTKRGFTRTRIGIIEERQPIIVGLTDQIRLNTAKLESFQSLEMSRPQIPLTKRRCEFTCSCSASQGEGHVPNNPVKHEQRSRSRRNLFAPVHTTPCIHRSKATHQTSAAKVEYSCVSDVRETAEMLVAEGPSNGFVCEGYVVGCEDISLSSEFGEFLSEIFALLGRDLRGL